MIICVCKAINDRAIRQAVAEGHDTFDALQFELGLGTCCGRCVPSACEVLCEARALHRESVTITDALPVRFAPRRTQREVALA